MRTIVVRISIIAMLLCSLGSQIVANADAVQHPLDALSAQEFWTIFDVLQNSGRVDTDTRYHLIALREPPKHDVLAWRPGATSPRQAFAIIRREPKTFEAVIDLRAKALIGWTELHGVQPNVTNEEVSAPMDALRANPEWQAAMRRRGITNYTTVSCVGASPGYFGAAEERGHRLLRVGCYQHYHAFEPDTRFIAGLDILWDVDAHKVLRVIDTGAVPVPRAPADYDPGSVQQRPPATPLRIEQPLGPDFRVDGHAISWQKWHFHFRLDRRVGLIVNNVAYDDAGKRRSILYEGSLSEVFVPYMDPGIEWYWATYFDAGEFADGFSSALDKSNDCPENAVYFDQVYADERGFPQLVPRAACLFERYAGDVAWRHTGTADPIESRKRRDLVLRTIATFGNYDYLFDWVFRQDGSIEIKVGATGVNEFMSVVAPAAVGRDHTSDTYGRFVAPNIVAPDHDHYFCFRLNFAIDGATNSFVRDQLARQTLPRGSARTSVWTASSIVARTELEARRRLSPEHPEIWRVINPHVRNAAGYPVGYELVPGENARSLMAPDDYPQRRAGFTDYQLWVTRYADDERYAAGTYPTQSKGGDGLPAWTRANRSIADTDIVVWYTMGFHHVPRAEDFPVMPTTWLSFALRPYNFFARNPALDLPRDP